MIFHSYVSHYQRVHQNRSPQEIEVESVILRRRRMCLDDTFTMFDATEEYSMTKKSPTMKQPIASSTLESNHQQIMDMKPRSSGNRTRKIVHLSGVDFCSWDLLDPVCQTTCCGIDGFTWCWHGMIRARPQPGGCITCQGWSRFSLSQNPWACSWSGSPPKSTSNKKIIKACVHEKLNQRLKLCSWLDN